MEMRQSLRANEMKAAANSSPYTSDLKKENSSISAALLYDIICMYEYVYKCYSLWEEIDTYLFNEAKLYFSSYEAESNF